MAEHQLAHRNADRPPQRIRDKGQQHLPGDEAWLIGEHRMSGEKKYYLANLPANTDLRTLAATIKARWKPRRLGGR
jgi:SRSO17 transposase